MDMFLLYVQFLVKNGHIIFRTNRHAHKKLKWYSLELNQAVFSQPYLKQKLVGEITGAKSRTTLTKYMAQLTKLGVLSAQEDGREVFYVNNDLIRILQN